MPRYRYPEPPPSAITPKSAWLNRRRLMAGLGAGLAVPSLAWARSLPPAAPWPGSTDEPLTSFEVATGYNNFFEFGTGKDDPARLAHSLRPDPWSVEVTGEVERPTVFDLDDLLASFALEERIYRLRCVEAWSKVIPWIGFPLADLLDAVGLTSRARYVAFETLYDPEQMPNQTSTILDWPYREGLRIDEAMHPLTILAVGMYGEVMPNQNGAPIRLVVPWKYGFKSIKSVVRIELVEDRPITSWQARQPREYGFFANVNPTVRHPRWHQATERRLHDGGRIRTEMFNGYAEEVAHLYAGMDLAENF
ncbi:MAG: protein-methionine-sulfoxide reductase catalytic subunit MsrP [Geminicoccaceae bacterium]|nr:MAG: protein-methionine-sulfoxide reductase catalytic subunit MsrP [Geminicoccaceae bacterium]